VANFLSNVLGVVVGIALTFGISYLIQKSNEKKQIRETMVLLKKEITDNQAVIGRIKEDFVQTKKAFGVLLSDEWKNLPPDTLSKHSFNARSVTSYNINRSAWNVFQQSDVIKNFDDKELIVALSELYGNINLMEEWWDIYCQEKMTAVSTRASGNDRIEFLEAFLSEKKVYEFMEEIYTFNKYTFEEPFDDTIDFADYILYLIDKSGNYHYSFKDLDKEFEQFKANRLESSEQPDDK
jgi:hypothetical protein